MELILGKKSTEKARSLDDVSDKAKLWELAEIIDPVQCRVVTIPGGMNPAKKVDIILNCPILC